jgi:hypothetical protein
MIAMPQLARAKSHTITWQGVEADCPSHEAVVDRLRVVFSDLTIDNEPRPGVLSVEIWQDGASYGVVVRSIRREFFDPGLHCEERARKVAVLIALELEPPSVSEPVPHPWRPRPKAIVELEIGGRAEVALRRADVPAAGGAQLRLFVGSRFVGGVLAVAGLSPTTLKLDVAGASFERIPVDVGVRGQVRRGRWSVSLECGLLLSFQVTEGLNVMPSLRQTRLELGARLAAQLKVQVWKRFSVFLAAHFEWLPSPNNLVLPSIGIVGTTPQYWIGGTAGVAVRLH